MKITRNSTIRLDKYKIGCLLAYAYILSTYIAQDLLVPTAINTLCLYVFLAFSAYVFITRFSASKSLSVFICWFILFGIASCITALYSPSFIEVSGTLYLMFVSFCLCLFLQMYAKNQQEFTGIAWCYAVSGFVLVVLLFLTGNLQGDAGNRLGQELTGNANIFASIMMVATMYTIWLLVYDTKNLLPKILLIVMIIADFYALSLSGGRKFFAIPFGFLYLLLCFKSNKNGRRKIFLYTVLFFVIVAVVWSLLMNIESLYNAIGVRMEGLLENLSGNKGDSSSQKREAMRKLAFEEWKSSPILGYGFDSFKYLGETVLGFFCYSHCNYTELLYNGGIFYFVLFYWIYYKILRNTFRNKRIPTAYKAFAVAATVSLFVFDYGAVSYNTTPTLIMLMMAYNASTFVNKETDANEQIANAEQASEK